MNGVDLLRAWVVGLFLVALATSCGQTGEIVIYNGSSGGGGSGGSSSSISAGGSDRPACEGVCLPLEPVGWLGPALLWIGEPGEAPDCPEAAPAKSRTVYAGLDATTDCDACKCDAPRGLCSLPLSMTAASAACPGDETGTTHTSFNPPSEWNGGCTSVGAIPPNQKCNGVSCVQSLTIGPLMLYQESCGVRSSTARAHAPPKWELAAQSCYGVPKGRCGSEAEICAAPTEPGFLQCITLAGDHKCPGAYKRKHLFYEGFKDTRSCAPCSCGSPVGSTCTSLVSVFKDGACSSLAVAGVVDTTGSVCLDVSPSGQALGSKLASTPVYAPGACQPSGGEAEGGVTPVTPVTYCCLE